jgi:hypothetical protein
MSTNNKILSTLFLGMAFFLSMQGNIPGYAAQDFRERAHVFSEFAKVNLKENGAEEIVNTTKEPEELVEGFLFRNYEYSLGEISEAEFQVFSRCLAVSTEITDSGVIRTSQCGQAVVQMSVVSEDDYVTVGVKVNSGNLEVSQEIHDLLMTNLED